MTMKRLFLTTVLALASLPAVAWEQTQHQGQRQTATGGAGGNGGSATGGIASATGGQGGSSVGGNITITGSGNGGGNGNGGFALGLPSLFNGSSCSGSLSLGFVSVGGGGGAGGGWEFEDCKRMREANALNALGFRQAAVNELCQIDRVRSAFGGHCPTVEVTPVWTPAAWCATASRDEQRRHYKECYQQ